MLKYDMNIKDIHKIRVFQIILKKIITIKKQQHCFAKLYLGTQKIEKISQLYF